MSLVPATMIKIALVLKMLVEADVAAPALGCQIQANLAGGSGVLAFACYWGKNEEKLTFKAYQFRELYLESSSY